jgi:hypothetical protein
LLDERSKTFETSTRLYVDWRVMNAHEFASALDGEPEFTWIDGELETQLRSASKAWKDGRRLMARGTNDALLLRQVICLRVVNGSKSPAKNIRLRAHVGDFDPRVGGGGELYGELPERHSFTISEIKVGELMERAQKENDLPTELLIPLAQAVGDQRYVGRVLVPMGLDWYDEPHQKAGRITIDPQTPQLRNRLNSARLGLSKDAD